MSTSGIDDCTASAWHRINEPIDLFLGEFCSIPLVMHVPTVCDLSVEAASSLLVCQGCPTDSQWVIDLVSKRAMGGHPRCSDEGTSVKFVPCAVEHCPAERQVDAAGPWGQQRA